MRGAWKEASPRMRGASKAMWAAGFAISAIGIFGDTRNWWADLQFVINLLSSLASGLFSLPVALIYLQHANEAEAKHRRRMYAVGVARGVVDDLVDHVDAITRDPSHLDELGPIVERLVSATATVGAGASFGPEAEALPADWRELRQRSYEAFAEPVEGHRKVLAALREWRQLEQGAPELAMYGYHWTSTNVRLPALLDNLQERIRALTLPAQRQDSIERAVKVLAAGRHDERSSDIIYDGVADMEDYADDVREIAGLVVELRREAFALQAAVQDADRPQKKNT
jgi:hypothetical protein